MNAAIQLDNIHESLPPALKQAQTISTHSPGRAAWVVRKLPLTIPQKELKVSFMVIEGNSLTLQTDEKAVAFYWKGVRKLITL